MVAWHSVRMLQPLVCKEYLGVQRCPTPVPNNILDLYRSQNSLEIEKLGVREDLCKLGSSLITEFAITNAAKKRKRRFELKSRPFDRPILSPTKWTP